MKLKLTLKTDLGIDFLMDNGKKADWLVCITYSFNIPNRYTKVKRLEKYEN